MTDKTNNYYTSSMDDFIDNKKPDLEFECPEHHMRVNKDGFWIMDNGLAQQQFTHEERIVPRVQKEYEVTTLSHKQNKPVKTVEIKEGR